MEPISTTAPESNQNAASTGQPDDSTGMQNDQMAAALFRAVIDSSLLDLVMEGVRDEQ